MKTLAYLLGCLLLAGTAAAQVSIGAKGGLNFSTLTGKKVDGYKMRVGIHVGGYAQLPLTNRLSLVPELYLSMQGARWEGEGDDKTATTYLQVPALIRYGAASGLYGETGPQLGLLLKATDHVDGGKDDVLQFVRKSDFSWAFGAGYRFKGKLAVYARYNLSFSRFYKQEKNSLLQAGVSYALFTAKQ